MSENITKFGLIGYPLSHSFSPTYFASKFAKEGITNTQYDLYPLAAIEELPSLIASGVSGLNVTIPYKEAVVPYLDILSPECHAIKAVNTIKIVDGKLLGYNTDVIGFEQTLRQLLGADIPAKALVLGTGGASKAVQYVLKKLGIRHTIVSRRPPYLTYSDITPAIMNAHKLIVNTTPLGMAPNVDAYPDLPYNHIGSKHFCYDLLYNPEKTIFLKRGEQQGAAIMNGYDMLIGQAEASWNIWNT